MNTVRIRLADITVDQLNASCLRTMGICALKLRNKHGVVVQLNHRKALPQLRRAIKKSKDNQLLILYQQLKEHLSESLREKGLIKPASHRTTPTGQSR